jgi:hypothetical protein
MSCGRWEILSCSIMSEVTYEKLKSLEENLVNCCRNIQKSSCARSAALLLCLE